MIFIMKWCFIPQVCIRPISFQSVNLKGKYSLNTVKLRFCYFVSEKNTTLNY